jgi:hypothetical protein
VDDYTNAELIRELRKPGKAFVCMTGTEILVSIEKADFIYTLSQLPAKEHMFMARRTDWGLHIEAIR